MKFTGALLAAFCLFSTCAIADDTPEMTFVLRGNGGNCIGCEWTAAEGVITNDTYKRFEEYAKGKRVATLHFDSPGGSLVGGLLLGEAIRKNGADTAVGKTIPDAYGFHAEAPGQCMSACAFAYLGGASRIYDEKQQLGCINSTIRRQLQNLTKRCSPQLTYPTSS